MCKENKPIKQGCIQSFLGGIISNGRWHFTLHVTKLLKKFVNNLVLSKTSDPCCIQVVVLKNCESEI